MTRLPPNVTERRDPGGRPLLQLDGPHGFVQVSPTGAQVLAWRHRGHDVLWTASRAEHAPGKPVRGGVPLVFPWFGDHATDRAQPAHGFARTLTWQLAAALPTALEFAVAGAAGSHPAFPAPFALRLRVGLADTLQLAWTVENPGPQPFACELAMHTYFAVGSVHTASVHGLEYVPCTEHAVAPEARWDRGRPLRFRAETDRIFQGVPGTVRLRCPALRREVELRTTGAPSAIVWTPWPAKAARLPQLGEGDWERFVCIESAAVRERGLRLAPGQQHTLGLELACRDLG